MGWLVCHVCILGCLILAHCTVGWICVTGLWVIISQFLGLWGFSWDFLLVPFFPPFFFFRSLLVLLMLLCLWFLAMSQQYYIMTWVFHEIFIFWLFVGLTCSSVCDFLVSLCMFTSASRCVCLDLSAGSKCKVHGFFSRKLAGSHLYHECWNHTGIFSIFYETLMFFLFPLASSRAYSVYIYPSQYLFGVLFSV